MFQLFIQVYDFHSMGFVGESNPLIISFQLVTSCTQRQI